MDEQNFKEALPSIPDFFCMPVELIHHNTSKYRREETADLRRRFLANRARSYNNDRSKQHDQRNEKPDTVMKDASRSAPNYTTRRTLHNLEVKTNKSVKLTRDKPRSAPPKFSFEHLAKEVFKRPELERLPYFVHVHADPRPPFDYPTATLSSAGCFFSKVSGIKSNNQASQSLDNKKSPDNTHASKRLPSPKHSAKDTTQILKLEKVSSTLESETPRKNNSPKSDKYQHASYQKTNIDWKTSSRELAGAKNSNICVSPEVKLTAQRILSASISSNCDQTNASRNALANHVSLVATPKDSTYYGKRPTSCFQQRERSETFSPKRSNQSFSDFSWNDQERKILTELKRNQFQGMTMTRARHCKDDPTKVTPKMRSRNHFIDPEWSSEIVGWARYAHPSTQKSFRFSWI